MFKIEIITLGKVKDRWLESAITDYQTRLTRDAKVNFTLVKDDAALVLAAQGASNPIVLDVKGKEVTSEKLSEVVCRQAATQIFIGGPDGLPGQLLHYPRYSLSPLTFTSQMTRLIVIEQLYRAIQIHKQTPYHRA